MIQIINLKYLEKPEIKYKNGSSSNKYQILSLLPYEKPVFYDFVVIDLTAGSNLKKQMITDFFDARNDPFPLHSNQTGHFSDFYVNQINFTFIESKEDDLPDLINNYANKIIIVIHKGKIEDHNYYKSKINAIINNSRIQFIDYSHLKGNSYQKYNIWVQLIAKCDGTPWIVDNSSQQFIDNDTLIIGISFSTLNNELTYGVAHFLDANNMVQEIILQKIKRDLSKRYLYLNTDEFSEIMRQGLNWFKTKHNDFGMENKAVKIFIYKSTPLHAEEKKSIEQMRNNPEHLGYDNIEFSHVHIKSENFGIPRIYDTSNYGTAFQYMPKQGVCLEIIPDNLSQNGFGFRGDIILGTTGMYSQGFGKFGGTKGTPKPLFMAVHSSLKDPIESIENQVMAMTNMDWEFTGANYRNPFILKYTNRVANLLHYMQDVTNIKPIIDIRDLM